MHLTKTVRLFGSAALLLAVPLAVPLAAQSPRLSSVAPPPAFTDPSRASKLASAFPVVDSLMKAFAERTKVPGIAWGIIVDGKLAHIGASGLRDVPAKAAVETTTVFRIASMTKSFTAVSILQLRDAGKISLDAPAERYVPELSKLRYATADAPRITVRDLLTHSAGFPEDNPWGDQQLARTDAELSQMIARGIPFSTSPSTGYEYSNFGFAILGRIVQNVSRMPYSQYVREKVLKPLGMTVSTLQFADVPAGGLAHGYRLQDGQWLEEPQLPDGSFGSMGGMLTSVADLSKWVGFMLDAWPPRDGAESGPLKRSSRREMQMVKRFNVDGTVSARDAAGKGVLTAGGYGYGLRVQQDCLFRTSVAHTGGLPGFGSLMRWLPEQGVGIVALGNLTYTPWTPVANEALTILAKTGGLAPRVPQAARVLNERRDQVSRLVLGWSEALADSLAAMNLYLDEPKPRRKIAMERVRTDAGGSCRNEGDLLALNALRGSWRMRCAGGDLRVTITLAPTEPAGVQFLSVAPMKRDDALSPAPVCAGVAVTGPPAGASAQAGKVAITIETSLGTIERAVRMDNQPANDVKIEVIQGGRAQGSAGFPPVPLERTNVTGIRHLDGTLSMARGGPDTATNEGHGHRAAHSKTDGECAGAYAADRDCPDRPARSVAE